VPFPDELARGLAVVAYDSRWPGDFAVLARRIQGALGPMAVRVNHVGSTSVPGLAAKDCIDVQVEVQALASIRALGPDLTAHHQDKLSAYSALHQPSMGGQRFGERPRAGNRGPKAVPHRA
jgi:GrpB-like predicted nucleotidyltransferase (UPF0157 family)